MTGLSQYIAFVSMPGTGEWIMLLVIGLLIFGRRLPEVARNLGKSVNEFKKGMREFQDSADEVARDVNKITNDVATDVKDATGMNDYGYQDPNTSTYDGSQYGYPESEAPAATETTTPAESSGTASDIVEDGAAQTEEAPATEDEHDPYVEPMK